MYTSHGRVFLLCIPVIASCGLDLEPADDLMTVGETLIGQNGLQENGLNGNGLNGNGLNSNGLNSNGLNSNGLNSNGFKSWFNTKDIDGDDDVDPDDRELHGEAMSYLVACACGAGTTRSFVDSAGRSWTWSGKLGLAPGFCAGSPPTTSERQKLSACMAAHVNSRGFRVTLSLAGLGMTRNALEKELWSFTESNFFGDLWQVSGGNTDRSRTYACRSYDDIGHRTALPRLGRDCGKACVFTGRCSVLVPMNRCQETCALNTDRTATSCSAEGRTYENVLSTFLPQRMEIGDSYNSADAHNRRCDDQYWSASCSANPLSATKSTGARWDVLNSNASENFPGAPGVGSTNTYVASFDASKTSWIRLPNHLTTTGTRKLNMLYTSPQSCQLKVSVNDGASYQTVTFPATSGLTNFQVVSASFQFNSTTPVIVLSTLGNGTCAPLVDWLFITT